MSAPRTLHRPGLVVCAALLAACSGDESAGSSATYTSATATATTTTGESESATDTTTDASASASDTDTTTTTTTTTTTSTSETTAVADPLILECGAPPAGAEGAKYSHQPTVTGGVPGYMWSASGLPDGLSINQFTGQITGTPTLAGAYAIELMVEDSQGTMAMTTCPSAEIAGHLGVDLSGLKTPCIPEGGSLLEYVEGGDGSPITCSTPGGTGNGKLPAGLTVDPGACKTSGSIAETRYGTWAWIVRAEQNGAELFVPYCATQSQQAPKAYAIKGAHAGGDQLAPATGTFTPGELIKFDGDGEPRFEVTTECGNACFYGFYYAVTPSPMGSGPCKDDADGCYGLCPLIADPNEQDGDTQVSCTLLPEMGLPKEGFAHEMWAKGDVPSASFEARPWIVQWSIDYCVSTETMACANKDAILANGNNSNLEFAIIMNPVSP